MRRAIAGPGLLGVNVDVTANTGYYYRRRQPGSWGYLANCLRSSRNQHNEALGRNEEDVYEDS